jgi:tRNA1(Val) A37 N6-methylase TrmN6
MSNENLMKSVKSKLPKLLKVMGQRGPFYVPGDEGGLGIDGSMLPNQMLTLANLMDIRESSVVFDLGCGNGYSTFILSLFNPLAIFGMDVKKNQIYQAMVTHVRLARSDVRPKRISIFSGDALKCSKTLSPATHGKLIC